MDNAPPLKDVLSDVSAATRGGSATLGDVLDALQTRGFGPVLAVFAAFLILPTGSIPLLPQLTGILLLFLSVQTLLGHRRARFPAWIRNRNLPLGPLRNSLAAAHRRLPRLTPILHERLTWATGPATYRLIALLTVLIGLLFIAFGVVPQFPRTTSVGLLLIGLGLSAHDGLFVLAGLVWLAILPLVIALLLI